MVDPYKEIYDENGDVYDDESVEEMLDDEDAISPQEEAFMRGYNQANKKRKSTSL